MIGESAENRYGETIGGSSGSRWPVAAAAGLALAVLAAVILISLLHLRRHIFEQIVSRDGDTLDALAAQQYLDDKEDESITSLRDTGEQITLALKISHRLRTVYGVRLFSPDGTLVTAFPFYITETAMGPSDLAELRNLRPVSHFVPGAQLSGQVLADPDREKEPLLEVAIPLREPGKNRLEGIAQFLIYGAGIAHEYAELDRHLVSQGLLAFCISGAIVTGGLLLAFRRVQRANALLAERTSNLLKANRELALAAKTSAIGALTSHLIHGLKNPLSGLRSFVQDRALDQESSRDSDWQLAIATTQRMQTLIDRVVRVLQEQQTVAEYEISLAELMEILAARLQPAAQSAGVRYRSCLSAQAVISNRQADLILLILENLVQNAIEATSAGKTVELRILHEGAGIRIEVQDQGPGVSPELKDLLFTPCRSGKKGGSGIGLAISRQLAIHLGATLQLKDSSSLGCCFSLRVPAAELCSPPKLSEAGALHDMAPSTHHDSVLADSDPKQIISNPKAET
jgi:signal transduction histidine kinase